jgi:hypothetical protein
VGLAVLLSPVLARAEPKSETSGLAIGGGVGYQTPVIGAEALFYVQASRGFRVAPYAGFGVFPLAGVTRTGAAGGAMAIFGGKHRGFLDLSYGLGAVEVTKNLATGVVLNSQVFYGVTLAGGYEYMADGGFFVHPAIGVTYFTTTSPLLDKKLAPALGVALGYKIW